MTTLYQTAIDVQNKIALCADDDGVIDVEKLELIETTYNNKAMAVGAYILNSSATIDMMKNHVKQMQEKIAHAEHQSERLKQYLADGMKMTGITEIKANDGTFSVKLYIDRDESVEIDATATFPHELCNPPKPPPPLTPSKTLIKEAIKRGEPIAGARIVKKDRLMIK